MNRDQWKTLEGLNAEERLKSRLHLLDSKERRELDEGPCCVYGLITRGALDNLAKEVQEVKNRVNTLLWGVAGITLLDALMRLAGK